MRALGEPIERGGVRDIGKHRQYLATLLAELRGQRFDSGAGDIGQHHFHTQPGRLPCQSFTDAGTSTGNNSNASRKYFFSL
jgi:hypothetical protein